MKKILYADTVGFKQHSHYYRNSIRALSRIGEVDLYLKKGFMEYSDLKISGVNESQLNCFPDYKKRKHRITFFIKNEIGQFRIVREILQVAKRKKYDLIVFAWVDIVPFSIATMFTKQNIVFIDHSIHLTVRYKWLSLFWKILNKKLKCGLLEPYFYEYVKDTLGCKLKMYILRHPITLPIENKIEGNHKGEIIVFAPGGNNRNDFIETLINHEEKIIDHIKIIIKGNKKYNGRTLTVYNDFLERDKYEEYFSKSTFILVPYDESYNYRTSGIIYDSVAANKRIILISGNTLIYYAEKYPNIFNVFSNVMDMIEWLNGVHKECCGNLVSEFFWQEVNKFKEHYSVEMLANDYMRVLNDKEYIFQK